MSGMLCSITPWVHHVSVRPVQHEDQTSANSLSQLLKCQLYMTIAKTLDAASQEGWKVR